MTFYQELQLNQAGSKLMIQEAVGRRAKAWQIGRASCRERV